MKPPFKASATAFRQVFGSFEGRNIHGLRFGELSLVAATVGERYGRWQGQECADLRQTLLKKEAGNATMWWSNSG